MDDDKQDDLMDYFLTADTDDLDTAMDELEDDGYNEDEVRLMRIKFTSEYANWSCISINFATANSFPKVSVSN